MEFNRLNLYSLLKTVLDKTEYQFDDFIQNITVKLPLETNQISGLGNFVKAIYKNSYKPEQTQIMKIMGGYIDTDGTLSVNALGELYVTKDALTIITDSRSEQIINVVGNTIYKFNTLKSLSISNIDISDYDSKIYFSSGSVATELSLSNDLLKNSYNKNICNADKKYIITICNGAFTMTESI